MSTYFRTGPSSRRYRLRRAVATDGPAVAGLAASREDLRQVAPLEEFPLDSSTVVHWIVSRQAGYVLLDEDLVVGYGELVADEDLEDRLWIGHMLVHPRRRGLGLGQRIVQELTRLAEMERDAREVAISAFADNPRALRCYLGCGFDEVERERIHGRELVGMRLGFASRNRTPRRFGAVAASIGALMVAGLLGASTTGRLLRVAPVLVVSAVVLVGVAWFAHRFCRERRDPAGLRWKALGKYVAAGAIPFYLSGCLGLWILGRSGDFVPWLMMATGTIVLWSASLGALLWM